MRTSKYLTHPALVILTAVCFLFLVAGCEKAVTYYDKDGKPYTVKEQDPWGTIGAIILTAIILGAIAASADSNSDGTTFLHGERPLFAYAGNRGFITDAHSGMHNPAKSFRIVDRKGNFISEHCIDVDKLLASRALVNLSEVQLYSMVDKKALKKLVSEAMTFNNLEHVPKAVRTNMSYVAGENVLRVSDISIPAITGQEKGVSELTVMSENGIYKVTTALNEKSGQGTGQFSVTVSQLN